ncbi:MAG: class I SAM-dependent methyltransferase [Spirochaetales bacterium]|nr:class I SAM-dependent methyltransferase [Spirochaetales bacterium]
MNNQKKTKDDSFRKDFDGFRPMSNLLFRFMAGFFSIRDKRSPPIRKIEAAEVKEGYTIVDYGCGPGGFTMAAARKAGPDGKVYAVDIHPLAIKTVQRKSRKLKLNNIETIHTRTKTGLRKNSSNIVLLFDIIHGFSDMTPFIDEFLTILKPDGLIAVDDHHMTEKSIIAAMTSSGQLCHWKTNGTVVLFRENKHRYN